MHAKKKNRVQKKKEAPEEFSKQLSRAEQLDLRMDLMLRENQERSKREQELSSEKRSKEVSKEELTGR